MIKSRAPNFTINEAHLATCDSSRSLAFFLKYSLYTFLVNRLAAAMDMTEAGTSAPIEMAANAKPANQDGKEALISAGTAPLLPNPGRGFTFAAIAMYPVNASRPSINE